MKAKKLPVGVFLLGFVFFLFLNATIIPKESSYVTVPQEKWTAPASADNLTNPIAEDRSSITEGKKLYNSLCAVCHGNHGKGDGPGGMGLHPKPANLILNSVQLQSDGAIFWKIEKGRPPMPSYETSIPEQKRWEIVNYIRTLTK